MAFAKDFVWGAATASYQIEGDYEGRGESVWDMYCRKAGAIQDGSDGKVACDHVHHAQEDVAFMQLAGLKGYRFSISWPRWMREGRGALNPEGVAFYDKLVDRLLEAGIEPYVTLFHWDYPQALFQQGGWLNPDSPKWFEEYAASVVHKLGDRVRHYMTHNEPQCFVGMGHMLGTHAPGLQLPTREVLQVTHNVLLAHGRAVRAIRRLNRVPSRIGMVPATNVYMPADPEDAALEQAAYEKTFDVYPGEPLNLSLYLDPIYLGRYPEQAFAAYGDDMPTVKAGDMDLIAQKLDFCAFNHYNGVYLTRDAEGCIVPMSEKTGAPHTQMDWPVTQDSLYYLPRFLYRRYGLPCLITENGMANADWVAVDGQVHDPQRVDYLTRYLRGLSRAADAGVPILGYFQWSFLDNFEWGCGYTKRFGMVYCDYEDGCRRIPKDSFAWYRDTIAAHGENL